MAGAAKSRRRTWSAFGDIRRVPSEYEIVTHEVNWTTRKNRTSALSGNISSPPNLWYLTYRDNSPLKVDDWSNFRDPDALIYRSYVTMQDEQESVVAGVLDEYSDAEHDATHSAAWRNTLASVFTPARYLVHAAQMCEAYLGVMAPSSYITNAASFTAADLFRRASLVAYRTRELEQAWPDDGFGAHERRIWETHPAWQPARKALELALVAYDWGEAFTALNLVLLPTLDDLLIRQLGEAARKNGDELTWLLLSNLDMDVERRARWSAALGRYALGRRPENRDTFDRWVEKWTPRAEAAAGGIAQLLESLPDHGRPAAASVAETRGARIRILRDAGLEDAA